MYFLFSDGLKSTQEAIQLSKVRPVLGNVIFLLMLAPLMIPSRVLVVPQYLTAASLPLPMSRPILGVVSIFSVAAVWQDFLWPLLVEDGYDPGRETRNVGSWRAVATTPQNLIIAAPASAAVPTMVFFLIFQRNIHGRPHRRCSLGMR